MHEKLRFCLKLKLFEETKLMSLLKLKLKYYYLLLLLKIVKNLNLKII